MRQYPDPALYLHALNLPLTTRYSRGSTPKPAHVGFFYLRATFEAAMSETIPPSRYLAREYLERRTSAPDPPPTREEVRRELGWTLITAERQARAERDERN